MIEFIKKNKMASGIIIFLILFAAGYFLFNVILMSKENTDRKNEVYNETMESLRNQQMHQND